MRATATAAASATAEARTREKPGETRAGKHVSKDRWSWSSRGDGGGRSSRKQVSVGGEAGGIDGGWSREQSKREERKRGTREGEEREER